MTNITKNNNHPSTKISNLENQLSMIQQHANNLENILNHQIKPARTFRLWQAYNRVKRSSLTVISDPKKIFKGIKVLFTKGPNGLIKKIKSVSDVQSRLLTINEQYHIWFNHNWPTKNTLTRQRLLQKDFLYRPLISIVTPVYNPDQVWLEACILSVINQTYDNWEFCLADDNSTKPHVKEVLKKFQRLDKRIKVVYRKQNGHISNASNSALKVAAGKFVALLDHDDELSPNALFEVVKLLNVKKDADLIYSDEDKLELDGKHVDPFFKPDWSPDMFLSTNYVCHLTVIRKKLIDSIKGFRVGYEGSQDYDLFLRITELTKNIYHIPKILYSWRKIPGSTAAVYSVKGYANQASINALTDALTRRKIHGSVENGLIEGIFRVKYEIKEKPLVSIVIPTKDKVNYLKRCLQSILEKTSYSNYEILVVDTGSIEKTTSQYYKELEKNNKIKILHWNFPFNYSVVNNFGVEHANGEYLLLLNNDTEIITHEWIEAMLEHAQRDEVGAVGAKLLFPNDTIQHIGVILGLKGGGVGRGVAGHALKTYPDVPLHGPLLNSKDMIRDFSAVTAACLMIKKTKYLEVKGLDPELRIAFNDVDFNLKLMTKGYYNVYTPYAKLYHHESISVGTPEKGTRNMGEFSKEVSLMLERWDHILENDPYYNKNLSLYKEDISIQI